MRKNNKEECSNYIFKSIDFETYLRKQILYLFSLIKELI